MHDAGFQVAFDNDDRVAELVLAGATPDSQEVGLEAALRVMYLRLDLFDDPAAAVIEAISSHSEPADDRDEFPTTVMFPLLGLELWRSEDWLPRFEALALRPHPPA